MIIGNQTTNLAETYFNQLPLENVDEILLLKDRPTYAECR